MLSRVTARCAVTLHAVRGAVASRDELRVRLAQQQAVARIGQLALTNVTLQELLDEACRVVATELRSDFAGILELVPDRSAFVIQAGVGWPDALVGMQRISADEHSQGGYTLRSNRPVIVRDTTRETRFTVHRELRRRGSRVV